MRHFSGPTVAVVGCGFLCIGEYGFMSAVGLPMADQPRDTTQAVANVVVFERQRGCDGHLVARVANLPVVMRNRPGAALNDVRESMRPESL